MRSLAQRPISAEARGQSATIFWAPGSPSSASLTARDTDVEHLKAEGGVFAWQHFYPSSLRR